MSPRTRSVTTPSVTGFTAVLDVNTSGYRNAWSEIANANMPAAASPARLIGSTTWKTACQRVAPSTSAASSISNGTFLKNPVSSHTVNGIEIVGSTTTSDQIEFWSPIECTTRVSGINSSVGGIRYVAKITMPS